MCGRILVPTDGSRGVERAISHAIDLATVHDGELTAVYVIDTQCYGGLPMETSWEGIRDVLVSDAEAALDRVRDLAENGDVPVETAILDGSPANAIVEHANSHGYDLVVMGTHGRSGVNRLLLGSVTERVVRAAEVPVLTVQIDDDVVVESTVEPTEDGRVGDSS